MFLKVRDIVNIMEQLAPLSLKEEYDNVGLMVGNLYDKVESILIALDCTEAVIDEAVQKGCSMIITHHPLLFRKPSTVTSETLQGRKIIKLISNNITLYSSHTNLDTVCGGINDLITGILGLDSTDISVMAEENSGEIKNCGIGRLCKLKEGITLAELCDKVKEALGLKVIKYSGDDEKLVQNIAVINGSGQDYFYTAAAQGSDCIITGDTTYHHVSDFCEEGIAIIDAGHFATEWPAMKLFAEVFACKLMKVGFENSVIISEKIKDPYKYK